MKIASAEDGLHKIMEMDNDWLWALRVTQMHQVTLREFDMDILRDRVAKQTLQSEQEVHKR